MPTPVFSSSFGNFNLERIPHDPTFTWRAWDAADEYCLSYFQEHFPDVQHPLVLNDSFGALGVCLHKRQPTLVNDSFVSQQAFVENLQRNRLNDLPVKQLDSLSPLPHSEIAIIKLPKAARYFEWQLRMLNKYLPARTPVIIGAMDKYLGKAFYTLAERYLDGATTSRARKKARLIVGQTSAKTGSNNPLYALNETLQLPEFDITLTSAPNVFSSRKLDIGSRFFLDNFPDLAACRKIIDLGCGNGVLGLMALKRQPGVRVTFVDESYHAIHSAKQSVALLLTGESTSCGGDISQQNVHYSVNHCLKGYEKDSSDAVLCNPPFHQQQAVGIQIAREMFRDSARVLRPSGTLYIIGNRHLGYHLELKKYFKRVSIIASDRKFVLFAAQK